MLNSLDNSPEVIDSRVVTQQNKNADRSELVEQEEVKSMRPERENKGIERYYQGESVELAWGKEKSQAGVGGRPSTADHTALSW